MALTIDPMHTTIGFSAKHMGLATVRGRFTRFSGEFQLDGLDPTTARGRVEVEVASLDTGNEMRDGDLRGPHFFDVEKYPTLVFALKSVTAKGGDEYTVVGDLTVKGITHQVTLLYEHGGTGNDPYGNTRIGGSLTGTVNRSDFGLTAGGAMVSEKIKIEVDGELVRPQEAATAGAAEAAKS